LSLLTRGGIKERREKREEKREQKGRGRRDGASK
jgi:hypothetical protein